MRNRKKSVQQPTEFFAQAPKHTVTSLIDGVRGGVLGESHVRSLLPVENKTHECVPNVQREIGADQVQCSVDEVLAILSLVGFGGQWRNDGQQPARTGQGSCGAAGAEIVSFVTADDEQPSTECLPVPTFVSRQQADQFDEDGLREILRVCSFNALELSPVQQQRSVQMNEPVPGVGLAGLAQSIQERERGRGHWGKDNRGRIPLKRSA
jgi:hypothetical protein